MPPTLDDAWAKVEWAHDKLIRLHELLEPFNKSEPYSVRDEINAERTERVLTAEHPEPVPHDVPFIFGDFIHALHSALDYVVCSAVESAGGTITTKHAFPIFPKRDQRIGDMLNGAPGQLVDLIERLQPYHEAERAERQGMPPAEAAAVAEHMPLMRLYRLSIEEKHRALLLATSVFSVLGMYIGHNRTKEEGSGIDFAFSPSYDKAVIRIPLDPSQPDEYFDPHFASEVTLVKEGPQGMPVEGLAGMLYNAVAHHVLAQVRQLPLLPLTRPRQLPFAPR